MEKDKDNLKNESAAHPIFDEFKNDNYKFSIFDNINNSFEKDNEENENINEEKLEQNKKIWKPRLYQQQIYEKAKSQNSIIFVETGKGKTFISIMLMANHLGIDINHLENNKKIDEKKKIIFLVCDTALINQQKKHIEEILGIQVGTIQGKKDKKSKSDYDTFIKKWDSFNIFVAIPSIIYKILSCGFITIFQISMLIFDECHHTSLEHPYNKIMDEFYFFYKKNEKKTPKNFHFPRIYGLTASPMKKRINGNSHQLAANEALVKLSENLDCEIIIDPEMINFGEKLNETKDKDEHLNIYVEIKTHIYSNEYKKVVVELFNNFFKKFAALAFSNFPEKYKEFSTKNYFDQYLEYVREKFKVSNLVNYNNICQENATFYNMKDYNKILFIFEKIQRHLFLILENLCLDSLITYFDKLVQLYDKLYQKKIEEEENKENSDNSSSLNDSNDNEGESEEEEIILKLDSDLIQNIKKIYQDIDDSLRSKKEKGELNYTSDRLGKLYYTIYKLFESNEKAKLIVFITNRIVAHILKPTLSKFLRQKFPNKSCEEIIGVNKKKNKSSLTLTPTITLNKLNKIVKDFNENKFDILIGTSAVEEGLDIQSCNAVISLVEIQTPKSYIQMKGRARKTNSHFYIFSYSQEEAIKKVEDFLAIGRKMKELFNTDIKRDFRRNDYISLKNKFIFHFIPETHSKLTLSNVSIFFNEIKQQIDSCNINFKTKIRVEEVLNSNPIKFIGIIDVSTNLKNFKKNNFNYKTDLFNSKDDAIKMCQFFALIALLNNGYLDNHFKFCKEKAKNN